MMQVEPKQKYCAKITDNLGDTVQIWCTGGKLEGYVPKK
jgi:hypothetical protein